MPFCVVFISDAPEIDIEEELVTSGKDYETKLKCVVHAEPKAKVHWLKDNATVSDLDHVHTFMEGNRHYYRIAKTQVSDFGKYKCIATNSKGTTNSKEIELTGKFLKLSLVVNTLLKSYLTDTHVKWAWWRYFKFFGLRGFSSFNFLILSFLVFRG
jgi:hypothetical protein